MRNIVLFAVTISVSFCPSVAIQVGGSSIRRCGQGGGSRANIIYMANPSVFSVAGQRHEVFLTNSMPTTCSDGSHVVSSWNAGTEERNEPFRTYNSLCASSAAPPARAGHAATVCHPFVGHKRNRPPKWAVEKWVEHYLSHGFGHVYWYVYDERVAVPSVQNTTWFVAPWLKNTRMWFGGQVTAIQHCLHWNKQQNNTWTLFADVDEYMVATPRYKEQRLDLVHMATDVKPTKGELAGIDLGEYRISDFTKRLGGSNDDQTVTRVSFKASNTSRGRALAHYGHRKTLTKNSLIKGCNIHYCTPINNSSVIHHHDPRDFALLHIKSLIEFISDECIVN